MVLAKLMNEIIGRSATINRVLILENYGLMGAGLEKLLADEASFEVFGFTRNDEAAVVAEIKRLRPDIIILVLESRAIGPVRLFELLEDYAPFHLLVFRESTNEIDYYQRERVMIENQISFIAWLKEK